jgi:hypothetical protein
MDNPFELTEHSMFHPKNIEKQAVFDTNMPYQGFLAKDIGAQPVQNNTSGFFGSSMHHN